MSKKTSAPPDFIFSIGNKLNPNVHIIKETYVNTHTKVKCICNNCNYVWDALPMDLRNGSGCPKCAGTMQKTNEEFLQEISSLNYDIKILGKYINHHTPILTECIKCGYIWSPQPKHLLNGHLCPKCAGNSKKSIKEIQNELYSNSFNIKIIGDYINCDTPMKFKCNECGYEWNQTYRNLKKSRGCPQCYPYTEKQDAIWMKKYDILKEYYNEYGNINIPVRTVIDNVRIGKWLDNQKKCYKNDKLPENQRDKTLGHISQKRIDLLNKLNINWK